MVGLAVAVMAAGCISSPTEPQQAVTEPTSVMIAPEQLTTTGGTLEQFSAEVLDAEGQPISGTTVTWKTNNRSVAIVDTDGYVWSFTEGTATATADFPGKGRGSSNGNAYGHSKKDATVSVTQVAPERPGRVSDLAVTSTTISSATLSFTEVGDGTGSPADYVVRFQVSPLDWGTATDVSSGTCSVPLGGGSVGSTRTCTVSNLAPDTNYQFQLVAYRGSYPSDMVYGDLSNVASGSTPAEPDPTQQPVAPGGSEGHPNEPSGLVRIAEHGFGCRPGAGCAMAGQWKESSNTDKQANLSVVDDQDVSGGKALRLQFPSGVPDGRSYTRFDGWGPTIDYGGANAYDELYMSFWLKVEGSGFENQTVGTKVFYISFGTNDRANESFMMLEGTYDDQAVMSSMRPVYYITQMNADGTDPRAAHKQAPNVDESKRIVAGRWAHVELYFRANSIDDSNGQFKMWVDGSLTHDLSNLRFRSAQNPLGFYHMQFTSVWGGDTDDVRTRNDWWRVANMYLSAR